MNWDRARRDQLVVQSVDYSARMDAAESQLWDTVSERRERQAAIAGVGTSTRPKKVKRTGRVSKAERLRREAAAAGISEAELRRRRRETAASERSLSAEARRRGIKVKQLRAHDRAGGGIVASAAPTERARDRLVGRPSEGRRNPYPVATA